MPADIPAAVTIRPLSWKRAPGSTMAAGASRRSQPPKLVDGQVVGRRPEAVEEAGPREQEGARAHAHRHLRGQRALLYPIYYYVIAQEGPRPPPSRDDEDVGLGAVRERMVRDDPQAVSRAHGAGRSGDRDHVEHRVVPELVRHREDLKRPREVEHLDLVEHEDGDVPPHGYLLA